MIIPPGSTSISTLIQIVDDDGIVVHGLTTAELDGWLMYVTNTGLSNILTLTDLTSNLDPWEDGGIIALGDGYYRVDLPNSLFATVGVIKLSVETTGMHVIHEPIQVRELVAADFATASLNGKGDWPSSSGNAAAVRTELSVELARIDTTISSRLAASGYTAPDNAGITNVPSLVWAYNNRTLSSGIPSLTEISDYLSSVHGSGSWVFNGPTVSQFNDRTIPSGMYSLSSDAQTLLSRMSAQRAANLDYIDYTVSNIMSGVWNYADRILTASDNLNIPTASQIDQQLGASHGSGSWVFNGPTVSEFNQRTLPSGDYGNLANQNTLLSRVTSDRAARLDYIDQHFSALASGVWAYVTRTLTSGAGIGFPTVQQIDAHLANVHGSGSWLSSSQDGSLVLDIYTLDSNNDPIGGTVVEVRGEGQSQLLSMLYSNTSTGKASFNLSSGSYDISAYKSAYASWNNPTTVQVNGANVSVNVYGTHLTAPSPSSAEKSTIYAYVVDLDAEPQENVEMIIVPSGQAQTYAQRSLAMRPISALSDSSGLVSIDVTINTPVRVRIPKTGLDKYLMSPASGSVNVTA